MQPVEPLLISWLEANFAVRASVEDPADLATLVQTTPFVRTLRTGGRSGFTLDEPRMDLEVFTPTKLASAILAGQIRDALVYSLMTYTVGTVSFGRVFVQQEPMWRPYDDVDVFCYGGIYQLYAHNS